MAKLLSWERWPAVQAEYAVVTGAPLTPALILEFSRFFTLKANFTRSERDAAIIAPQKVEPLRACNRIVIDFSNFILIDVLLRRSKRCGTL